MTTFLEYINSDMYLIDKIHNTTDYTKIGNLLKQMTHFNEEIYLAAVTQNGATIYFIENPSAVVQIAAITDFTPALFKIKNPCSEAFILAILKEPDLLNLVPEKDQRHWMRFSVDIFSHLPKEVQEGILEKRPDLINRIRNLDPELKERYKNTIKGSNSGFF